MRTTDLRVAFIKHQRRKEWDRIKSEFLQKEDNRRLEKYLKKFTEQIQRIKNGRNQEKEIQEITFSR
jgi:hypothetical protein